ncbi:hypothetical protein [Buchananella hordeovulneris]|uniref:hypothetical protein n=1 Tax=Buchananella hordeovulneris TaxID=52770 RepID=UPI0011612CF0|nr:hypothetical protein [Buchananella hordeovulneris]
MANNKTLLSFTFATCLVATACAAEPLNIAPSPVPTRFLARDGMVIRDELHLNFPPGWEIEYVNNPDNRRVAKAHRRGKNNFGDGFLTVDFLSQLPKYRQQAVVPPSELLEMALKAAGPPPGIPVKRLDITEINGDPAIGHHYTLSGNDLTHTLENYCIYRSDGIWLFSLYSPIDEPIAPEIHEAVFNSTWAEVTEPNVSYFGPKEELVL